MSLIERLESSVRSYCRAFPTSFTRASGALVHDVRGRRYLDFFAGAGALNYGHNPPRVREALLRYLSEDGIGHALDMTTEAKVAFLDVFERLIVPRAGPWRVMFTGPTGTNSVEAAVKLARKVTGRTSVVAFTNGFHGMTLGALALTGSRRERAGAGVPLGDVVRLPFEGYLGPDIDTLTLAERMLADPSSGIDSPAAFVVETVQAEGGVNVASAAWLRRLAALCTAHGALLIIDDIQVGCGRTGPFFSFEEAGISPDLVCLSKSISGIGLPMALLLIRPELDRWSPGEHNGTFRGNNLAFVTARAALELHWSSTALSRRVAEASQTVEARLGSLAQRYGLTTRGRGLIQGLVFDDTPAHASKVARAAFERGLIIETAGGHGQVLKILPPLTIEPALLEEGLAVVATAVEAVLGPS